MSSRLFPWQTDDWKRIQRMRGRWPHAILLHGARGIGKTVFAEWLAQSLLCETPLDDGQACTTCLSCGWFSQYSHPDYRRVRPEILDQEAAADEADSAADAESAEPKGTSRSTRAPSKEIIIAQVRGLSEFLTLSTHRKGIRAITVYPAETMNTAAANALLKSLEEPGANTVFILVTNSLDGLLPTVISRCRQFALSMPDLGQALGWLQQQGINRAEPLLTEYGGAPLAALEAAQAENAEEQQTFLSQLQRPAPETALKLAESLQKTAPALLIGWMQRWLYDVFSFKLTGKIRYYPRYQKEIGQLAGAFEMPDLLALIDANRRRRAAADHPLSNRLVLEQMLLEYGARCNMRA